MIWDVTSYVVVDYTGLDIYLDDVREAAQKWNLIDGSES